MMTLCKTLLALAASAVALPALAADIAPLEPAAFEDMHTGKPAVSGLNGKLEVGYSFFQYDLFDGVPESEVNAQNVYGIGSLSLPVGEQFGVQIDAGLMHGFQDDVGPGGFLQVEHDAYGIAGHFFWRDPDVALVGLYAHYQRVNRDTSILNVINFPRETDVIRVAAAGEYYMGDVSLEGHAGADFLTTTLNIGPFELTDSGTFLNARGVAAYYPTDNARIFAGAKYAFEEFAGLAGAEMLFASENPVAPAVFVEGSLGEDSASVNAGIRLYFGPEGKSLKRRHREDDPSAQLFRDLAALNACSSTINIEDEGSESSCGLGVDPDDVEDIIEFIDLVDEPEIP